MGGLVALRTLSTSIEFIDRLDGRTRCEIGPTKGVESIVLLDCRQTGWEEIGFLFRRVCLLFVVVWVWFWNEPILCSSQRSASVWAFVFPDRLGSWENVSSFLWLSIENIITFNKRRRWKGEWKKSRTQLARDKSSIKSNNPEVFSWNLLFQTTCRNKSWSNQRRRSVENTNEQSTTLFVYETKDLYFSGGQWNVGGKWRSMICFSWTRSAAAWQFLLYFHWVLGVLFDCIM